MCKDDATTAAAMRNATIVYDPTRPITMNHIVSVRCPAYALTVVHVCGLTSCGACADSRRARCRIWIYKECRIERVHIWIASTLRIL